MAQGFWKEEEQEGAGLVQILILGAGDRQEPVNKILLRYRTTSFWRTAVSPLLCCFAYLKQGNSQIWAGWGMTENLLLINLRKKIESLPEARSGEMSDFNRRGVSPRAVG